MNATTQAMTEFRPIGTVEASLLESWRGVAQATHRFLVLVREFDLRAGWKPCGHDRQDRHDDHTHHDRDDHTHHDCAQWLDGRCGIAPVRAREVVRIAHALWNLPLISEAFARGDLSYSKVRALCSVAAPANERDLLEVALGSTTAVVEACCRRLRNGDRELSAADARRLHERRSLIRRLREDGSGMLIVELPGDRLDLVLAALETVSKSLPEDPTRSMFATGADALVAMAEGLLCAHVADAGFAAAPVEVVVHVDERALSGLGGEADLPVAVVRRLCCDGSVVPVVEDPQRNALEVGRRRRTVPTAIRRALFARDRGCVFPGCHHTRYLAAHHVDHWADGGEATLANLLTLCTHHHRLVHEGGFAIERNGERGFGFTGPDGQVVELPGNRGRCEAGPPA